MQQTQSRSVAGRDARDLTQGPIGRTLLTFALPVIGGNLLQSLNATINSIWVGRLLGDVALAATGNANQIFFLLLSAGIGFGMAATILIGQALGRRDLDSAKAIVGATAAFFTVIAIVIGLGGAALTTPLLHAMGTPAAVLPLARDYLRVIFLAMPILYLNVFAGMALRGAGDSKTPFRFMLVGAVLDVLCNPLLIHGWGPIPALGIMGAALSTLISQTIAFVALLVHLARRQSPLLLRGADRKLIKLGGRIIRTIVFMGVPMGLQMIVVSLSGITMISVANQYGVSLVAGYNVAITLWAYVQMPAMAVGAASSSFAAQNIGARRWDRVDQIALKGSLLAAALTLMGIVFVLAFEHPLIKLFLPDDARALAVAERVNMIGLWGWLFFGAMMVLGSVVRAAGAVWPPLIIVTLSLMILRIPFVLWAQTGLGLGADAIWWSSSGSLAMGLLLSWLYYRFGNWRNAKVRTQFGAARPPATEAQPAH
ncbi:MAG: MATE family efflux transporter [Sphingomonadaceae bacterium]|nr:MATE family efflux transporter [Sphingomonadaceae bacterium]